jgi:O-acetyl-ADP-ribose deacetylase (regulator of RNase III)
MRKLRVIIFDANKEVVDALASEARHRAIPDCLDIEFIHGDVRVIEADAYVSPANAFGWMDGGIDAVYAAMWPDAQPIVHEAIRWRPFGELPIGMADMVAVDEGRRYLIIAPTMRLPRDAVGADHIMTAMRAALMKAFANFSIGTVAIPGLGTGSGAMPPRFAAAAMLFAVEQFGRPIPAVHWTAVRATECAGMQPRVYQEPVLRMPPRHPGRLTV